MPGVRYFGGRLFVCKNGHQGNAALNAAKNIGYLFYKDGIQKNDIALLSE